MKLIIKKSLIVLLGLSLYQNVFSQAPNISYTSASLTSGTAFTVSPANSGGAVPATVYGQVTTFAGSTTESSGYVNATGTAALFNNPKRLVRDASGNFYVTDYANNAIRKITPAGVVTTYAGSLTGTSGYKDTIAASALFNGPGGIAIDVSGNLFVSDYNNNAIRKITSAGVVTTFYHSSGTFGPAGLCFDSSGNLIVAAQSLCQILKITPAGVVSTIAGNYYGYANGTGTAALFKNESDVKIDASGNLFVADYLNNAIRKITPAGVVTTYAGSSVSGNTGGFLDNVGTAAKFNTPTGVAVTPSGIVYVADYSNNGIRRIMPDGTVKLVAGSLTQVSGNVDATGTAATFHSPISIYIDNTGTGYVCDVWASVRKVVLTGYTITGTLPAGLTFDSTSGTISGIPTGTITTQTDTITAYNASGYSTATVTFSPAVVIPAPNISYATSANALTAGTAFSVTPTNTGGAVPATTYGQVTIFAGSTSQSSGYTNGTGTAALFNNPQRIVGDAAGNLYVADFGNNAIRKITSAGVVTTLAGSATGASGFTDGSGTAALFNGPNGLAMDASGNLFVSDNGNNAIRKITSAGVVSTFYSLTGTFGPSGLCFDGSGNLIVAAKSLSRILKITPAAVMTVIAGNYYGYANGTGTAALFENPTDVQIDASGNIYVADYLNNAIRKITPAGVVTTYAGSDVSGNTGGYVNATGTAARFNNPTGIALAAGGIIYVEDFVNNDIRKIMPDGSVTLVAGSPTHAAGATDGTGTSVLFHSPIDLYIDATGTGYSVDVWSSIRKVVLTGYSISGTLPAGLTFDSTTGTISGTPTGAITAQTDTITAYNASGYSSTVISFSPPALPPAISYNGSQSYTYNVGTPISMLTPTVTGNPVPYTGYTTTFAGDGTQNSIDGIGTAASFGAPDGIAVDSKGNIYVTDVYPTNEIRKISPSAVVTTLAGSATKGFTNGTGAAATFNHPVGLAADTAGNVYVADQSNNAIRKISPAGVVTTFAGGTLGSADGTGTAAQFYNPTGVVLDVAGNIYVADYRNNAIRKITPAGVVSTFAGGTQGSADGTGMAAQFYLPSRLAIDASGNIYVSDKGNSKIRKITPAGVVTTVAGNGTAGFADGPAASAMFNGLEGLAIDNIGNIYVADYNNFRIRQISPAGIVTTLAGSSAFGHNDGVGSAATFGSVYGGTPAIAIDASGTICVGEYQNNRIRKTVTTPYTISPALPIGLSFDPSTGIISGTPTTVTPAANYMITAYNMQGKGSTTINIATNIATPPAPSSDQNYVTTYTPRVSGIITSTALNTASADNTKVETNVQYFDGLGMPLQTVQYEGSPTGKDIIQPFAYDQLGRDSVNYLPYTLASSAPGSYQSNALRASGGYIAGGQYQFYQQSGQGYMNTLYPYSGINYEPSPLNRVIEKGASGAAWQPITSGVTGSGHTAKMVYTLNNNTTFAADSVSSLQAANYYVTINSDNSQTLHNNGYYAANMLTVTITKDENWTSGRAGTAEEYKDISGRVVLKRVYNYKNSAVEMLSTYYVYDDFGHLSFVLPPASGADGAGAISQATLDNLCYQYQYDQRGRLIQKRIPGKGWEYTVYNMIDQPVATQDSLQRIQKNWLFTKYDALGRPVLSGIWNNGNVAITRTALQTTLNGISSNLYEAPANTGNGYTNVAWPATNITATLSTNYYDTYANIPGLPATYTVTSGVSQMTRSLPTVKKTAVLNTPTDQLWDVMYYDDLGRTTKTYAQHYLGGTANTANYDLSTTTYNFTNAPTTATRQHWNTTSTTVPLVTIANTYLYDHLGRKVKTWEQITNGNSAPTTKTLISQIDYNEIGQVLTKHLHSTDSLNFFQNVTYAYNERGWLLTSSAPLFAMQLYYNTGTNKQYNGNIAYQYWGTPGSLNYNYTYTYDRLNRLASGKSGDYFDEQAITYDQMGNITALNRYQAGTLIDQLAYTYNGTNQLQSITDATTNDSGLKHGTFSYTYDGNGNLLTDPSKGATGIGITYNLLNLPQSVTGSKTITYTYDATGNKLRRVSPATGNTDYIRGIQYDGTTTSTLSFIQTEEGKAVPIGTTYNYEYYLGDNLGNTRVTFDSSTGAARQVQQDDYYPFGMEIARFQNGAKNEYLYNKKELQEELGTYDYGWRQYDPVIARWNVIDPLTEKMRRFSPYTYCFDEPISFEDPDGMLPGDPVKDPHIRKTSGSQNKSRFMRENRTNRDGTVRHHYGVDILAKKGTPINSMLNGKVASTVKTFTPGEKAANSFGNTVTVKSDVDGKAVYTMYGHFDQVNVKKGDNVIAGETVLGKAGTTGNASGLPESEQHTHIEASASEIFKPAAGGQGTRIDPEQFMTTKFDSNGNPIPTQAPLPVGIRAPESGAKYTPQSNPLF